MFYYFLLIREILGENFKFFVKFGFQNQKLGTHPKIMAYDFSIVENNS